MKDLKIMNKKLISALLGASLMLGACTDLNETLYDKVSMDDYGQTSNEVQTIVVHGNFII